MQSLQTIIKSDPKNVGAHVQLANAYFDAERYADAIKWYEESLKLDPKNPDASTDLGVSYYYSGRTDDALKQFENSLKLNPKHAKTLFNQGIVLAFGKRDLQGATSAWQTQHWSTRGEKPSSAISRQHPPMPAASACHWGASAMPSSASVTTSKSA